MIGGFLGAGKTTAVLRLAKWLTDRGHRVGLIDNDQGSRLVDTALIEARGFAVEEISGGCFCCRFNSLVEAASKLTARSRPDVFIAEPVGSCTDLVATVTYPLRRLYGEQYRIAPLSVLVDPTRAARMLGLEPGPRFSAKVEYIYGKQLEEADVLVVNKSDQLSTERRATLVEALRGRYPSAAIHVVSARTGAGLDEWFTGIVRGNQVPRPVMDVDYEVYAEGEALLGWMNAAYRFTAESPVDANALLESLAEALRARLVVAGGDIAHLKMTLEARGAVPELAVVNLVRNDYVPELAERISEPVANGDLTLNMRVEASPEVLRAAWAEVLATAGGRPFAGVPLSFREEHLEAFRPGKPEPTHRVTA